jgi:hypothetical protein
MGLGQRWKLLGWLEVSAIGAFASLWWVSNWRQEERNGTKREQGKCVWWSWGLRGEKMDASNVWACAFASRALVNFYRSEL